MLKQLKIKNFKILKDHTFEFGNLNLFTGMNGMGKSSALQALLLLRQSYLKADRTLPEKGLFLGRRENGVPTNEVAVGKGKDVLYADAEETESIYFGIIDAQDKQEFYFDYKRKSEIDDKESEKKLKEVEEMDYLRLNPQSNFKDSFWQNSLFKYDNFFHYLSAERIAPREENTVSSTLVEERKSMGTRGEYALYYLYKYGNQPITNTKVLHPDTEEGENILSVQVNYWLSHITPKVQVRANYDSSANSVRGTFQIGDSPEFKPTNVGFGLTYVLPIIIALLTAKEGAMIIIENPESDLHPAAQSKIAELIVRCANSGRQVFIETHSDHIINGILVAISQSFKNPDLYKYENIKSDKVKLYYFDIPNANEQTHVTPINISETGRIKHPPKGFFDQFNIDLKRLLR